MEGEFTLVPEEGAAAVLGAIAGGLFVLEGGIAGMMIAPLRTAEEGI